MFDGNFDNYVCLTKEEYTALVESKIKYDLIVDCAVHCKYSSEIENMVLALCGEAKKED